MSAAKTRPSGRVGRLSGARPGSADTRATEPLLSAIQALVAWFDDREVPAVVIGGIAVSLLARPRFTRDVDALMIVDDGRWPELLEAAGRFGLVPRISEPLRFAARTRVLLLRHDPTGIDVDVSSGLLPFEREVVARASRTLVGSVRIPLPTVDDLIILKAVAHRPRDLADVEYLAEAARSLNRRRIRRLVGQFAEALDAPEILGDLDAVLRRVRWRTSRRPARPRTRGT